MTASKIVIQLNADSPADLAMLVEELAKHMNPARVEGVSISQSPDDNSVETKIVVDTTPDVEPKPKRKARPKKTKAEPNADGDLPAPDTPAQIETTAAPPDGAVADLSPEDARAKAVREAQMLFSKDPAMGPEIGKITKKYGVTKLVDVKASDAHALLADVHLLSAGSPEAA